MFFVASISSPGGVPGPIDVSLVNREAFAMMSIGGGATSLAAAVCGRALVSADHAIIAPTITAAAVVAMPRRINAVAPSRTLAGLACDGGASVREALRW